MQYSFKEQLNRCSASTYCELILNQPETRAEETYYLLTHRLSQALRIIYDTHGFGFIDEYEDTINDFFLYLYDDNPCCDGPPFAMIKNIHNKNAFFAWILSTYRNFLLNKAKEAERIRATQTIAIMVNKEDEHPISEEQRCQILANAIAYADQQLATTKRFMLYRLLLSFLDHRMAIPQEEMAKVLNLNATTYRVYTKRQKDRLLSYINTQECGGILDLDREHLIMRDDLLSGFDHLYATLGRYYRLTLEQLPNADEIVQLRKRFSQGKNELMHDQSAVYGNINVDRIDVLYEHLKTFLAR